MYQRHLLLIRRLATHPLPLAVLTLLLLLITHHSLLITAVAQSATATLSGTVEDENGAVIPGAAITILNPSTALQRQATTNDQGSFTVTLLQPGTYTVTVRREGFAPIEVKNVVLNVADQKALKIELKAGDVNATVQVTSEAPLISESPAVGTVVDREFVGNLPLNGRSFQSLLTLTPGVQLIPSGGLISGQFSVNGQRTSANNFAVDGVSANVGVAPNVSSPTVVSSGNLGGLTALGTTQSLTSVDAMEEFRVETSTFAAEHGRQPGGQISLVTRSGSNQFHGLLFDYLRNDVFDAKDWFANRAGLPKPPTRQNNFGGTFSGPVMLPRFGEGGRQPGYDGHNRTFFFFSYEGLRLLQPRSALTNVPTLALRQQAPAALQPILNAFPLPNGKDLGNGMAELNATYSDPSNLDATSIRLDHTVSSRITLFGRYNRVPSEAITRSIARQSQFSSNKIKTQTITLGATASFTRLSNELRVNYTDNWGSIVVGEDNFGGAIPPPRSPFILPQFDSPGAIFQANLIFSGRTSPNISQVAFGADLLNSLRQFNLVDNVSYVAGSHQLKFGVDYRRVAPIIRITQYSLNANFISQQQVLNSTAGSASVFSGIIARPIFKNFSVYGQDAWKLSRRLSLHLGLRWEVNPAPTEASGNHPLAVTEISNLSTMQLAPRGTKMWKTTYNNFAPRIGLAYQLTQKPGAEAVVRGGFGVYYDTGNDLGAGQFYGYPFAGFTSISNLAFPLSPVHVAPAIIPYSAASLTPPFPFLYVFDPALKLPYTLQWNVAIQQSLGKSQALTVSYVGAAGRNLLQGTHQSLSTINPNFTTVLITRNSATSDYNALQAQFQRRLSRGLQALASYTWSHALDDDSSSAAFFVPVRGNSSFDVRHNFAGALTYDVPTPRANPILRALLGHWSVDTRLNAWSAFPVNLIASTRTNPVDGSLFFIRPNVIAGVPLYVTDPTVPGGRKINRAAFSVPPAGVQGNLGRNQLRGLGLWQQDLAIRREFSLSERVKLQFRAESFNIFNHPNFGGVSTSLAAANFGQAVNMVNNQTAIGTNSLYQIGGPRSFQFALKLMF